jgi:hypothetical protein
MSNSSQCIRFVSTFFVIAMLSLPTQGMANNEALLKLFDILRAKGSITNEEYQQLVAVAEAEKPSAAPATAAASEPLATAVPASRVESLEERLAENEEEMRALEQKIAESKQTLTDFKETVDDTPAELVEKALKGKWFENLGFRGYAQFRFNSLLDEYDPALNVPADRSASDTESFMVRRARVILSGDVTDHLYIYAQTDFAGSTGSGDNALVMRDFYADISLDPAKEFRFRVGQSKVPFGFVNMQSSQNRAAFERSDALNSAVEGERDIGAFFYWAPKEIRDRYKKLVKDGLKGSGDYGVFGFGAYSGQGLNRSDVNGQTHWVARLAYPFEMPNGQFMELGLQGYTGNFVPTTQTIRVNGANVTPTTSPGGHTDQRVALSAILFPQPFGIEAEWTWGRGPQLRDDFSSIGVESLQGGYIQANYLLKTSKGVFFPFLRYNHYEGARKFGRNAPWDNVTEIDVGLEWSPVPELELTLMYTHTLERTNTALAPYREVENANRIGLQLQWNF